YFPSVISLLAGELNPSRAADVEDADHTFDAVFELRPVIQEELLRVVFFKSAVGS
ncbi:hypothetical protein J6590_107110, partial [Homalodisca vitripennis]